MLPVTAITSCNCSTACPQRYWYGLPPWPAGQYAWRRQFDASAVHPGIPPAYNQTIQRVSPAYFVELRALDLAKNEISQTVSAQGSTSTRSVSPRPWPFRSPPPPIAAASPPDTARSPQYPGSILDFFA